MLKNKSVLLSKTDGSRDRRRGKFGFVPYSRCGDHNAGEATSTVVPIILPGKVRPASLSPEAMANKGTRHRALKELQEVD